MPQKKSKSSQAQRTAAKKRQSAGRKKSSRGNLTAAQRQVLRRGLLVLFLGAVIVGGILIWKKYRTDPTPGATLEEPSQTAQTFQTDPTQSAGTAPSTGTNETVAPTQGQTVPSATEGTAATTPEPTQGATIPLTDPTQPTQPTQPVNPPTTAATKPTEGTDPTATQPTVYEGEEPPLEELLILINATHYIPQDWEVDLVALRNGHKIDRRAYPSLQKMMDDCRAAGNDPLICSSYRTQETQTILYERRVQRWKDEHPGCTDQEARDGAAFWVARPGTSEHQLGFAVDIVSTSNQKLNSSQEKTKTQQWLMQNSWRYGWILRYPTDKSDITKVGYEPWHYRYVGVEAAAEIYELGICLEEYLGILD